LIRRALRIGIGGVCTCIALVFAATATPAAQTASADRVLSCDLPIQIGMMAPITGPAASIGDDQLHWALFFVNQWNATHKLKINIVQGDTQLDAKQASTVSQSFASNTSMLGVIGPAGSQEVQAAGPILKKAGLPFISGSATNVTLTNGQLKGSFFRVVPNDGVQAPTDANFMIHNLGATKGTTVMIVDDQESYSTGLADIATKTLKAAGVNVDRESVSQKATDFSALVAKVGDSTKAVFLPFQISSEAQLFAQQLKAQGKKAIVLGSDGTFDSSNYNVPGDYVSFFASDVTRVPADKAIVAAYHKAFPGGTSPFGAPNYLAAQVYATAATKACADGKITRSELAKDVASVHLASTILNPGKPFSFTANGDVAGAAFHVFKIMPGKVYVPVS
jgi:branched-chain amino acid transport system substrate-binding protein